MKPSTITVLLVVATATGGFFVGRMTSPKSSLSDDGKLNVTQGAASADSPGGVKLLGGTSGNAGKAGAGASTNPGTRSPEDLKRMLELAFRDPSPVQRAANLTKVLESLNAKSLPDVLKAFEDIPVRSEHMQEFQMLLFAWASFDPAAALDYAAKKGNARGIGKDQLFQPVITAWAQNDPKEAAKWITSLPEKDRQPGLIRGLVQGWAVKDPYGATEYVGAMPENKQRETLLGDISAHLIKSSVDDATRWADSIKDPKLRGQAMEELVEDWASLDPAAASKWLGGHLKDDNSAEAAEDLARGWASVDPKAASQWFEKLPEGVSKDKGIYQLAKNWDDLKGLSEWLNGMSDSSATNWGVRGYAERLAEKSPDAALTSASSISDPKMRDETMRQIASQWNMRDPQSAQAWAQQNNFPLEQMTTPSEDQIRRGLMERGINPGQEQMRQAQDAVRMLQEVGAKFQQLKLEFPKPGN